MLNTVQSTWYYCPHCRGKLLRYFPHTRLYDFPAWCKRCKREVVVTLGM